MGTRIYLFLNGMYTDACVLMADASPRSLYACLVAWLAVLSLVEWRFVRRRSPVLVLVTALYLTFVASITLLGRRPGVGDGGVGLFETYAGAYGGNAGSRLDILYNVLLYVPVGALLARYGHPLAEVGLVSLMVLAIECAQLVTGRGMFELSDMVNNVAGGALGLALALAARRAWRRCERRRNT